MYTLPDLSYKYDALEPHIDSETMMIHHDKHHGSYVQNLNEALSEFPKYYDMEVTDILKNIKTIPDSIKTKVRNNAGGHANHSFFWEIMTPDIKGPSENILNVINVTFGNIDTLKERIIQAGVGRFGSGWVWLVVNKDKLEIVDTANQDNPITDGKIPILGVDVWEHAYYLKYQNRRADYINAWWNVINWGEVEKVLNTS